VTGATEAREPSPSSLDAIGICMSGGGFRAAAFHLGTLDYLHQLGLGDSLRQISTVSGGTFVGAAYTLSLVEKQSYETFFSNFYAFLRDVDLVSLGLGRLADGVGPLPSGRQDLIVAMAETYAETFLSDPEGRPYHLGDILDADIRLTDAVFNVTEFRHGLAFRFQRARESAKIGNGRVDIPRDAARAIRVADIVAASSCFPGGFEPLDFPTDFSWPENRVPQGITDALREGGYESSVALMDGGIFDNQGIDSLLLGAESGRDQLSWLVISDVDQADDELYAFPKQVDDHSGPTVGRLRAYLVSLGVLCGLSALSIVAQLLKSARSDTLGWIDIPLYGVPLILSGAVAYVVWWVYGKLRNQVLPMVPNMGRAAWKDLRRLRLDQLLDMMNLRLTSLLALTSKVFMKRVRSLVYRRIYSDRRFSNKRISNLIDDLNLRDDEPWKSPADEVQAPSPALRKLGRREATMPTPLWFDAPGELPALVAAGQAGLCLNLMRWVQRCHGSDPATWSPEVARLWTQLVADWGIMNSSPYGVLERHQGLAPPTQPGD
jgi:predicted acylesterase/phospholipase RssA